MTEQRTLHQWCLKAKEDPIEPLLGIVDPHHHFWKGMDLTKFDFSSLGEPGRIPMAECYMLPELQEDMKGNNVTQTVYLQCNQFYDEVQSDPELKPIGETKFCKEIHDQTSGSVCSGVVAYANMLLGADVERVIKAHMEAFPGGLKGIRHGFPYAEKDSGVVAWAEKNCTYKPEWRAAMKVLAQHNLSFDVWCYHLQLPDLRDLAKACPETTIILDHVGIPLGVGSFDRETVRQGDWKKGIAELSECPNVYVKLSGLPMKCCGFGFDSRDTPPSSDELAAAYSAYYLYVIEKFGVKRCMFASNFPVDKATAGYTTVWNAFKKIVKDFTEEDKQRLFNGTATDVYKLTK